MSYMTVYHCLYLKIPKSDIGAQIKWAVSLVTTDGHFNLPLGFVRAAWVKSPWGFLPILSTEITLPVLWLCCKADSQVALRRRVGFYSLKWYIRIVQYIMKRWSLFFIKHKRDRLCCIEQHSIVYITKAMQSYLTGVHIRVALLHDLFMFTSCPWSITAACCGCTFTSLSTRWWRCGYRRGCRGGCSRRSSTCNISERASISCGPHFFKVLGQCQQITVSMAIISRD